MWILLGQGAMHEERGRRDGGRGGSVRKGERETCVCVCVCVAEQHYNDDNNSSVK